MNIPLTAHDITFERFIEIKKVDQNFLQEPTIEKLIQVTKFWHDHSVPVGEMPEKDFQYTLGEAVTHCKTYIHVLNLINNYKPTSTGRFKYKGKEWHVSSIVNERMTVNEYIISVECERRMKEIEDDKRDLSGQFEFSLTLKEFACLVRLKDENIPIDKADRDKFLTKRMELFQDIPMSYVLNVQSFFLNTINEYAATTNLTHILQESQNTRQSSQQNIRKQKTGKKTISKKYGKERGITRFIPNWLRLV